MLPNYVIICYVYLLLLSLFSTGLSMWIGIKTNLNIFNNLYFDRYLYYAYITILFLSFVQIYQSVDLLFSKYNDYWWIPMFCKNMSLLVYIFINFYIINLVSQKFPCDLNKELCNEDFCN